MLWSSHEAVPRVIFTQGISIVRSLPVRVIAIRVVAARSPPSRHISVDFDSDFVTIFL